MTKRGPDQLMRDIFAQLSDGTPKTPTQIASTIGSNSSTIKSYMRLIEWVQSQPRIAIESAANVTIARIVK